MVSLVGGFSRDVWGGIAEYTGLNLTRIVTVSAWGSEHHLNGTIVGALSAGEADVSVNWLAHCCGRMRVVQLSDTLFTRGERNLVVVSTQRSRLAKSKKKSSRLSRVQKLVGLIF